MKKTWKKVWKEFNEWLYKKERICKSCGEPTGYPDWEQQTKKIEELVIKHFKLK